MGGTTWDLCKGQLERIGNFFILDWSLSIQVPRCSRPFPVSPLFRPLPSLPQGTDPCLLSSPGLTLSSEEGLSQTNRAKSKNDLPHSRSPPPPQCALFQGFRRLSPLALASPSPQQTRKTLRLPPQRCLAVPPMHVEQPAAAEK